jgi:hypothetical protein
MPADDKPEFDIMDCFSGAKMSNSEAEALEEQLLADPNHEFSVGLMFFLAVYAFDSAQMDFATNVCKRMLNFSETYSRYGQLVHTAHIILGRIALRNDDTAAAREHLIAASEAGNSPRSTRQFGKRASDYSATFVVHPLSV